MTTADQVGASASACALHPGMTVEAIRRRAARELRDHGLDSPDLDARLLVGHALGLDHAALAAQSRRPLAPAEAAAVTALVARRLAREPVARIIGNKEFWGLRLQAQFGNPPAPARERDRGRGGSRCPRIRARRLAGATPRRPRHRFGSTSSRIAVRAPARLRHRHRPQPVRTRLCPGQRRSH